ncbi:DUF86 domain-containing protein [Synechococcus sp. CS-1325]|uniref:HepT-like ribonuclease domain-containing protein n=1 Tax=Synechococcus sp. CS-1325 TaxID=2847979 RepID=UPI00223C3DEE|nr:HepT-like ribonuclease domain-containing protein [Synechococcus sp. CS-1325]MCT0199308.1 DUF86 domain-containing protein [Synechococcus sp. CS-1325]
MIEAGQAIQQAVAGISLDEYSNSRLIRSSVEREFIIIGEALMQLSQRDQVLFEQIGPTQQIISFRNKLTHEYIKINNQLVWGVINNDLPALVDHCRELLTRLDRDLP